MNTHRLVFPFLSIRFLLALAVTLSLLGVPPPQAARANPMEKRPAWLLSPLTRAAESRTVTWRGNDGDGRWSNPANWGAGRVPGRNDSVQLSGGQTIVFDAPQPLASLILTADFSGVLTLARPLAVAGDLVIAGGTLAQGSQPIHVASLTQNGGEILGGSAPFTVDDAARIYAGTWMTPGALTTARTLDIAAGAIVRLGENGKLELTGDGEPLTGDGELDTLTHRPNSVEYTGQTVNDLIQASPASAWREMGEITAPSIYPSSNGSGPVGPLAFEQTGSLTMNHVEAYLDSAVIDTAGGYAYYGTDTTPGIVVKVRLSDFTRVGALTLDTGENSPRSAVMDATSGYAYFGMNTSPGRVVKVRLSDFTRVSALTLDTGENNLRSAVIDAAGGYAYFGTNTAPGIVVKVQLADFTRVGALTLNSGEASLLSAVIDTAGGYAYFGTSTSPGRVIKVKLSDFTRESVLTLNSGDDFLYSAVIDADGGYVYFGTITSPGRVVRVKLSDFTHAGALTFVSGENNLTSAVIDPAGGYAYFGTWSDPATVVKVKLSDFTRESALVLNSGEASLYSAVIDTAGGYAYFGTSTSPGRVIKVQLSDFTRVSALMFNALEPYLSSAVIDTAAGYAYFGTDSAPSTVIKVRLSDFTRVGAITLNTGEYALRSAVIDTDAGYAYFGTSTWPARVIKVQLSDFTRVGVLETTEGQFNSAVIDTAGGYAYFGSSISPATVTKVKLSDFTRVGALTFSSGENFAQSAVIDPAGGYAYFGLGTAPGTVVKVQLSDFTRVGALTLATGENYPYSAVIDAASGNAYFGTYTSPGIVVKVQLSDFTRVGALTLATGENNLWGTAVIAPTRGHAYFGTWTTPGIVVKMQLSDFTRVGAVTLGSGQDTLRSAVIDAAGGYAYFGTNTSPGIVARIVIKSLSEIDLQGQSVSIPDGDATPSFSDDTDYGNVAVSGSLVHTFTIHNTGSETLNLTDTPRVSLSGSSDFVVTQQPSAATITPGNSLTFEVTFTPSSSGARTATVSIASDDEDENLYDFTLRGWGGTTCTAASSGSWSTVFSGCSPGAKRIVPADITMTLNEDMTLTGDFEIQPGGTFNPNGKTVTLTGDAAQTLTGNPLTFYRLVLDKTNKTDIVTVVGKLKVSSKLTITKGKLKSASDYGDILIETDGILELNSDITVSGHFTNSGEFDANGYGVIFDGAVTQHLAANAFTWFQDLTVETGTTLIESVSDDNVLVQGTLTNNGVIRKTQVIDGLGFFNFGIAGEFDGADLEMEVTSDSFSDITVSWYEQDHANASATAGLGRYWNITPSGSGVVNLTLPHDVSPDTNASACRYTGSGNTWACGRSSSTADTVTLEGVTSFSDWSVGNGAPLSAVLAGFDAQQQGAAILVNWETVSEIGNLGFNLWRGVTPNAPDLLLNSALIPSAAPGSSQGFSYEWLDSADLVGGTTYHYWLEDVDSSGVVTRHGPVSAGFDHAPTAIRLTGARSVSASFSPVSAITVAVFIAAAWMMKRRRRPVVADRQD